MAIQPEKKSPPLPKPRPNPFSNSSNWWVLLVLILVLAYVYYSNGHGSQSEISYGLFRRQLDIEKNVESVTVQGVEGLSGSSKRPRVDPGNQAASWARSSRPRCRRWPFPTRRWTACCGNSSREIQGFRAHRQHHGGAAGVLADSRWGCCWACGSCSAGPAIRSFPAA